MKKAHLLQKILIKFFVPGIKAIKIAGFISKGIMHKKATNNIEKLWYSQTNLHIINLVNRFQDFYQEGEKSKSHRQNEFALNKKTTVTNIT